MFVFGDFNIHHKDWLTYSGGTGGPGKLYYNFSLLNDLTLMLNFPTRIAQCNRVHSFGFIYFCSKMAFPALESSDQVGVLVFTDIPSNSKWDVLCLRTAYDYSWADCMVLVII